MSPKKKRQPRSPEGCLGSPAPSAEPEPVSWEARALSRVRPHVRQLAEDAGAHAAGWETETLTRLERYFDRDEV
jgi:hypothetical protein